MSRLLKILWFCQITPIQEKPMVEYKHLSKAERKLTYNDQLFIIKAANSNIGVVRAHNLYSGLKGSSSIVHGWKRGKSSQKTFLLTISLRMSSFVVYFRLMKLRTATTRSLRETMEAYGWLLRAFKKAFVHAPNIVLTDQDGSMRLAVAVEFPESKHRLCMWHIMQKIPSMISVFETIIVSRIYDETDFKDKFGKIVWTMFIGPEEFEDRWNKLMEECNLVNHKWLLKTYRLRSS
ncbi:FAR1-related sequence 5-like protein [Tanacetum coccineum]